MSDEHDIDTCCAWQLAARPGDRVRRAAAARRRTEPRVRSRAAQRAEAGLVAPLADDTSDEIVSWVDGQVVTDWPAEIAKRERAIERLSERHRSGARARSTASAAASIRGWPGAGSATTRSGSTACRSCSSRRFSISIPNHENPTLRAIARIWKREATRAGGLGSLQRQRGRSITSASGPTRPTTSTASRGPPASGSRRCRSDSRSRTRARSSRCRRPRRRSTTAGCWRGASSRTRSLLVAKLRATDTRGELGARPSGLRQPGPMDRVFFSCAACHVGRVMVAGR